MHFFSGRKKNRNLWETLKKEREKKNKNSSTSIFKKLTQLFLKQVFYCVFQNVKVKNKMYRYGEGKNFSAQPTIFLNTFANYNFPAMTVYKI